MNGATRFLIPLVLAVAAAVANWQVLKRSTAKVEVLVLNTDLAEGEEVTRKHLKVLRIQADARLLPNALRPGELGDFTDLAVRRSVKAGELLLRSDLELALRPLEANEIGCTVRVPVIAADMSLLPGDMVVLAVAVGDGKASQTFGPYRLRGWRPAEGKDQARVRPYYLAVPNDTSDRTAQTLIELGREKAVRSIGPVKKSSNGPASESHAQRK